MSLSNFGSISLTTLSHQLPLFYQTGFRLPTFILRHLNSVFLQYVCFSLPDGDLLKILGRFKMKECIWVNIHKQQLPNSHWESQPLLVLARMIHRPALQAPSSPSSWLLCSSWQEPTSLSFVLNKIQCHPACGESLQQFGMLLHQIASSIANTMVCRFSQLTTVQVKRCKWWAGYKPRETATA